MKHLFLVHSFATYRCALGVIAHESIEFSSCIFVTYRGFSCDELPEGIEVGELPSIGTPNLNSLRRLFEGKKNLSRRDAEVDALTLGETFHCYTPHTYFDFAHFIVSHPQCLGFSYIEEGLTSYYQLSEVDDAYEPWQFVRRVKFLRRLLFGKRLVPEIAFFREGYAKAYGFCDTSFPEWERKITIGIDQLFPKLESAPCEHPPLLVFDALVEWKRTSLSSFCRALKKFLDACVQDGITELQYKLHPGQDEQGSVLVIREMMQAYKNIKVTELPASVCLEDLFESFRLKVFVFNSASGLYAALAGQCVYSLNPFVMCEDPTYGTTVDSLPSIYTSLVKSYGG